MNSPERSTITDYYMADHNRLEKLFRNFQEKKRSDFDQAKENFLKFKAGLERHIVWEEEILFPLFESKTGAKDVGPTVIMRMEHQEIKQVLEAIADKVEASSPETDAEETSLISLLSQHNQKEEDILYPYIDRILVEEERNHVFQKMKQIPEAPLPQKRQGSKDDLRSRSTGKNFGKGSGRS